MTESVDWMELLADARIVKRQFLDDLIREANEILALVVASIRAGRGNSGRERA